MRLTLNALANHLQQGLAPLYLLFGKEILLCEEALEQVRLQAKNQGYAERLHFTYETGFDWSTILVHSQSLSIFAEKRIIELRIPTNSPGEAGAKALIELSENLPADTTFVVICGEIEKRTQTTKWFKAMEQHGVVVECPAISKQNLPQWIGQRLQAKGLKFDASAVEALSQFVEGNLLAATQEINLLSLLYPDTTLTQQHIKKIITDHARFDVYGFVDACLVGDTSRSMRILKSLRLAQLEPVIILWALTRETRKLWRLAQATERGENHQALFQRLGIWRSRAAIINRALQKHRRQDCERLLVRLSKVDLMAKGSAPLQRGDIWEEIEHLALRLGGLRIV